MRMLAVLVLASLAQISAPLRRPDVVYQPTPDTIVLAMLNMAQVTSRDIVYDLGSGDGRIPIAAARMFGARGVGIEIEPNLIKRSNDNLARAGLNVIDPRGVFIRVTGSFVTQRFANTAISDLPRSTFGLVDLDISYEFAGKRGLANLRVSNAFDRRFSTVLESITIDPFIPDRRAYASLRWRLW